MASGFVWLLDPVESFVPGYESWLKKFEQAVYRLFQFYTPQIESWMRINAPWTDRTGNARQSLRAEVYRLMSDLGTVIVIELRYGNKGAEISYAQYLERGHAGRYSILRPAVDYWTPILLNAIWRMMRKS